MPEPEFKKEQWSRLDADAEEAYASMMAAATRAMRTHLDRVWSWALLEIKPGMLPEGAQAAIFKVTAHALTEAREEHHGLYVWDEPCHHQVRPSEEECVDCRKEAAAK